MDAFSNGLIHQLKKESKNENDCLAPDPVRSPPDPKELVESLSEPNFDFSELVEPLRSPTFEFLKQSSA